MARTPRLAMASGPLRGGWTSDLEELVGDWAVQCQGISVRQREVYVSLRRQVFVLKFIGLVSSVVLTTFISTEKKDQNTDAARYAVTVLMSIIASVAAGVQMLGDYEKRCSAATKRVETSNRLAGEIEQTLALPVLMRGKAPGVTRGWLERLVKARKVDSDGEDAGTTAALRQSAGSISAYAISEYSLAESTNEARAERPDNVTIVVDPVARGRVNSEL